mgnify:CR=1 FL=1
MLRPYFQTLVQVHRVNRLRCGFRVVPSERPSQHPACGFGGVGMARTTRVYASLLFLS